jgi:hypothetical protein
MTRSATGREGAVYRIRIAGRLDEHWSAWFGDLTLTAGENGTTTLTAVVADQAALHGLLARIRDLGIPLMSLEVVPSAGDGA